MPFQNRKKRRKKLDSLINLFLKTNPINHYLMKREVIYKVLKKENLNKMMILYFKIGRIFAQRKLLIV
jgi:hypothetical protein